jgi:CheY-like chemotaxis protein
MHESKLLKEYMILTQKVPRLNRETSHQSLAPFVPFIGMRIYKHLLLVEDDEDDQEFFLETVRQIDSTIRCAVAANGQKALQFLITTKSSPQIIFSDQYMPVMDVYEFLRHLKTEGLYEGYKQIPIVVFTSSEGDEQKALRNGAQLCIAKPATSKVYYNMLSTLLSFDVRKDNELLRDLIKYKVRMGDSG